MEASEYCFQLILEITVKNINRLIIAGNLNLNSLSGKLDNIMLVMQQKKHFYAP